MPGTARVVPKDPRFVPTSEAVEDALDMLQGVEPDVIDADFVTFDKPEWIDPGEALLTVGCPACLHVHRPDQTEADTLRWWQDLQVEVHNREYEAVVAMPCCRQTVAFRDLRLTPPCAFASCEFQASWYGDESEVPRPCWRRLARSSAALGCRCRSSEGGGGEHLSGPGCQLGTRPLSVLVRGGVGSD